MSLPITTTLGWPRATGPDPVARPDARHALAGVGALLCGAAAVVFERGVLAPSDSPARIAAHYAANREALLAQALIFLASAAFFLWFAGLLAVVLLRADPRRPLLPTLVLGAAVVSTTLNVLAVSIQAGLALSGPAAGEPALVAVMGVLFAATGLPGALLLLAMAAQLARTRSMPRWLLWLTVATAVTQLVPVAGIAATTGPLAAGGWLAAYLPYPLYAAWLAATTVVLFRATRGPQDADGTALAAA